MGEPEEIARQWDSSEAFDEYRRSFERGDRFYSQQFYRKTINPQWEGPFAFLANMHVGSSSPIERAVNSSVNAVRKALRF